MTLNHVQGLERPKDLVRDYGALDLWGIKHLEIDLAIILGTKANGSSLGLSFPPRNRKSSRDLE